MVNRTAKSAAIRGLFKWASERAREGESERATAGEPGGRGSSDRLPEPGFMPVLGTSEGVLTAEYEPGC